MTSDDVRYEYLTSSVGLGFRAFFLCSWLPSVAAAPELLEKVPRSEAIASARGFGGGVSASLSRGGEGILGLPPEEARAEHSSASLNMEPATTRQPSDSKCASTRGALVLAIEITRGESSEVYL